jgi:hypothetical protein
MKTKMPKAKSGFIRCRLFADEVTTLVEDHGDKQAHNLTYDLNTMIKDFIAKNIAAFVVPIASFTGRTQRILIKQRPVFAGDTR